MRTMTYGNRSFSGVWRWTARVCLFTLHLAIGYAVAVPSQGQTTSVKPRVDFERDVLPIWRRACFECHSKLKVEGELRLDQREVALSHDSLRPNSSGVVELVRRLRLPKGHDEVMPAIGEPLSESQIEIVERWIAEGADWPKDVDTSKHWAYVVPKRPDVPQVADDHKLLQPIDRFVRRRLESEGLVPSPKALPEKLIRRVSFDLIGLPPSVEEVERFLADPSSMRFEAYVDELLSRPQFGEHWARPWLDAARYADSHGFQRDNLREMWAYRDWVIRAINEDMPFDQFTIEQIAGDLLPNATEAQKVASGFHRCTPINVEAGSLPEETRIEQVIDRVNTTASVWLGTTLECCQCHDHKYDPFTQRDYYRLLAYFNNTVLEADRLDPKRPSSIDFIGPTMPLANASRDLQLSEIDQRIEKAKGEQALLRERLLEGFDAWKAALSVQSDKGSMQSNLEIVEFRSEEPTDSFKKLDDGGILLNGADPPNTDTYTAVGRCAQKGVRALRLDVLRHADIAGGGPGRGTDARKNIVLNELTASIRKRSASEADSQQAERKLRFVSAKASFSQAKWDVFGAVDGDSKSGWAISPQFNRSHWAMFVLDEPLDLTEEDELVVRMSQQFGQARTIGCFRLSVISGDIDQEALPSDVAKLVAEDDKNWKKADRQKITDYFLGKNKAYAGLATKLAGLQNERKAISSDTTLVMVEDTTPRRTTMFQRGDYRKPGEEVEAGTPAILHPLDRQTGNRIDLARWLVARDNPLTARVTVNRLWSELFGRGLVSTPEDFGIKGEPPTHPDLLDWLAVEFMENHWSIKHLLKTIVMSETYQQSSFVSPQLQAKDDRNQLLARGPRERLSAEAIRDNALAVSGLLNLTQFGPPIRPYQPEGIWKKVGGTAYSYDISPGSEQHRRGIYVVLKRGTPYPSFINFDATPRLTCKLQRSRTNTPLQALTLLNDPVYVEAAASLAERMQKSSTSSSFDSRVELGFQLCTARKPSAYEVGVLRKLYEAEKHADPNEKSEKSEQKAWQSIATVLLNMHETITKD